MATPAAESVKTVAATEAAAPYELSMDKMLTDTLMFLALLFGIFYFLLIRPQQKRYKEFQKMLESVKKGSRVVTGGGIIGVVTKLEGDDVAVVEIAPNVKVRVARSSISEVVDESKLPASTANDN